MFALNRRYQQVRAALLVSVRHDAQAAGLDEKAANARAYGVQRCFDQLTRLPAIALLDEDESGRSRQDAQGAAFFATQLEYIQTEVYNEEFADLPFANGEIIPFEPGIPEGAQTYSYYLYSGAGVARFMSSYAKGSLPLVTISGAKVSAQIHLYANAYAWSTEDVRAAAFAGLPLESDLAKHARRAHDELLNDTAAWGREDLGLAGLLNHPNITISDAPATGTGSSQAWVDKSIDQILLDLNTLITTPERITFGREKVTTVLLPRDALILLRTLRMGAGDGTLTVIDFVSKAYPGVTFVEVDELSATGSSGNLAADAAFAFVRGAATLVAPMQFKQQPVQQEDLMFKVPCESKTGGVKMVRPIAAHRMDGIGAS